MWFLGLWRHATLQLNTRFSAKHVAYIFRIHPEDTGRISFGSICSQLHGVKTQIIAIRKLTKLTLVTAILPSMPHFISASVFCRLLFAVYLSSCAFSSNSHCITYLIAPSLAPVPSALIFMSWIQLSACVMPSLVKLTAHSTPSNCFTQIYLTSIYFPVFVLILICIHPLFSSFPPSTVFPPVAAECRRISPR